MHTLKGIATNIRFSTSVSGNKEGVSTSHIAVFELNSVPVELKLSDSIFISEGDQLHVAGCSKRGMFRAIAYHNKTRGVMGKQSALFYMIFGGVLCVWGIGIVLNPFRGEGVIWFFPIPLSLGIWCLAIAFKIENAFNRVQ